MLSLSPRELFAFVLPDSTLLTNWIDDIVVEMLEVGSELELMLMALHLTNKLLRSKALETVGKLIFLRSSIPKTKPSTSRQNIFLLSIFMADLFLGNQMMLPIFPYARPKPLC